jgi:prephenate dehydratase
MQPSAATLARVRVAFQGESGAISEEAIGRLWRGAAESVAMRSFEDVMTAAETARVDFGLLPIESTLIGGVDVAYDLLAMHDALWVVAETVLEIQLNVLALPSATLAGLRTLASHPIMLAQCAYFFDRHRHIQPHPMWDTAGAAREVAERGDPTWAAAAGPLAAERFGLVTLVERIQDRSDTMMRFLAVAPEPAALAPGVAARTAVLCALPDTTGALLRLFEPLATRALNVSHFASRPTRDPWRYHYFLEFEHPAQDPRATQALAAIQRACTVSRLLGTFPQWRDPARPLDAAVGPHVP